MKSALALVLLAAGCSPEPMPPVSAVPPITAAAMACSSRPSPNDGSAERRRKVVTMPANPATREQSMKQNSFTRRVSIPMSSAACRWPPVA